MKTPHQIAAEIASINEQTIGFIRSMAARAYELVNTEGKQQEILDAFPALGMVAAEAVGAYAAFHAALTAIGEAGALPAPNLDVFPPQPDGSVLYVAPVAETVIPAPPGE